MSAIPRKNDEITRRKYTEREIALMYPFSIRTLQKWRLLGKGPPWYRAGGRVLYDASEVEQWVREGSNAAA